MRDVRVEGCSFESSELRDHFGPGEPLKIKTTSHLIIPSLARGSPRGCLWHLSRCVLLHLEGCCSGHDGGTLGHLPWRGILRNICLSGSRSGSFESTVSCGHVCARMAPWGALCVTSATLQHSIFDCACQGLGHSNRLVCGVILAYRQI
jgi:hypothetical protein